MVPHHFHSGSHYLCILVYFSVYLREIRPKAVNAESWPISHVVDRVGMKVVVVVVVVRVLFFHMTSVICVWIRGHRSEVMTIPYHFSSDFHRSQVRGYDHPLPL